MIQEMTNCGACRTCEMVCSYHHTGEFNPHCSSLKIVEDPQGPGFLVRLLEETGPEGWACDGCRDLETPLCLEYCREAEELKVILARFWTAREAARPGRGTEPSPPKLTTRIRPS